MSASLERDSGFNSGSSEHEDDLKSLDQSSRDGLNSPENSSEDSTPEVTKLPTTPVVVTAVASSLVKNKRKSSEPLRVVAETELLAPLKKRIRYEDERKHVEDRDQHQQQQRQDRDDLDSSSPAPSSRTASSPFRPWAPASLEGSVVPLPAPFVTPYPNPADLLVRHPAVTTLHRAVSIKPLEQLQPLALVAKKSSSSGTSSSSLSKDESVRPSARSSSSHSPQLIPEWKLQEHLQEHLHSHPQSSAAQQFVQPRAPPSLDDTNDSITDHESTTAGSGHKSSSSGTAGSQTRNYKNMTRERRIEANARERTRVHTISAAYEKLRRAIPAYSNAQKLSKLSILRIACSYILTLSRMAGEDYSEDASEPSIAECVEMVTRTIQTEGKIRKKKDE
uniref:BHLH domain-containing protein n=1 Tax=Anopheles farauti TaxID=69004 RepID=A0A182QZ10_9DIPT